MTSTPSNQVSAAKLALMARQARAQFGPVIRAEPIAIVGMACRFPGGAKDPEGYWQVLRDGIDAVCEISTDRWDVAATFDPDPAVPGKSSARHAGLVEGIAEFDAGFFGILPREAQRMDPQQRLFMEVAIDALDDAGLTREQLAGTRAGVYVASYHNDYTMLQYADPGAIDSRTLTGTLHSVIANRLSHLLDLRGPSLSLDSACSSSLVAVHLACQSLRSGESDVALAGGVSVIAAPDLMIALTKVGFTSKQGRCRTFDAGADGFVRGEGCGVVVLKRLADALAAGDKVLSVIRSSVVNQDGHSTVMAAPNGLAQQALVREALEVAQLEPTRIGYVETHGTATPLGDPIEVEALAHVLGAPRPDGSVCYLGSAKANIGHLEAAAGVAGLIKATLVLRHGQIPRQINFERPNPHLMIDGTCLRIPSAPQPWRRGSLPRVAGVSSFGVGGTNAHVLVEEAPDVPAPAPAPHGRTLILPISAQSEPALRQMAAAWLQHLESSEETSASLCAAAARRRSHYDHRFAAVGDTAADLLHALRNYLQGSATSTSAIGTRQSSGPGRLAFVFCGQGPQWFAMGRELAASEAVFARVLDEIDALLQPHSCWSLRKVLDADEPESRLAETEYAQPALFAIHVALAALWKSWGVEPDGVVGHSIGEIAALHVAGVLDLPEAVRIVWQRASAMQRAPADGAMAAISLDEGAARRVIGSHGDTISIGAVNSPNGVVLSGARPVLDEVLVALEAQGVSHRRLAVQYAFHSAQMASLAEEFVGALGPVHTRPPRLSFYSTVSGAAANGGFGADYFGHNIRQPVRFGAAVQAMLADGFGIFLEIGPHPALATSIADCATGRDPAPLLLASMRRQRPELSSMLTSAAQLYVHQRSLRWDVISPARPATSALPAYPWQRQRYWLRQPPSSARSAGAPYSECLGRRLPAAAARIFEASWPHDAPTWLADHRVGDRLLVPAAAMLEALREAACDALGSNAACLRDFVVHRPLALDEQEGRATVWQVGADRADHDDIWRLRLHEAYMDTGSVPAWRLVASAVASVDSGKMPAAQSGDEAKAFNDAETHDFYAAFDRIGVRFGPSFRTVRALRVGLNGAIAHLERASPSSAADGLHPTLLDGTLQAVVAAATGGDAARAGELLLPVSVDRYLVQGPVPPSVTAHLTWRREVTGGSLVADAVLTTVDHRPVAEIGGARFAPASIESLSSGNAASADWLYDVTWVPVDREPGAALAAKAWILLVDDTGATEAVTAALQAVGCVCERVPAGNAERLSDALSRDGWRRGLPLAGVMHVAAIDLPPDRSIDDSRIDQLTSISGLIAYQELLRYGQPDLPLVLVTRGAQAVAGCNVPCTPAAGLWGLQAAIAAEQPDFPCRVVDLDSDSPTIDVAGLLAEPAAQKTIPRRMALRGARRLRPRLRHLPVPDDRPAVLCCDKSGVIEDLGWKPLSLAAPAPGEARVRVVAAGINFRDVLVSLGMYPGGADLPLGAECAGIVESVGSGVGNLRPGDAVFGFAPRSLATIVNVPATFLAPMPASLSMEQAAALPVAFLTAMYGLLRVAQLGSGMSVLVHSAAGGVGMAAVQLALRAGATVYATAGSAAKRRLLEELGAHIVMDSRSTVFSDEILRITGGRGVDVVLNSLAGDFIGASVEALADDGCFLELGKRDLWTPQQFMQKRPRARYVVYDLGSEAHADSGLLAPMLRELSEGLLSGSLRALPVRVFGFDGVHDAFRLMAQARHVGKLVLRSDHVAASQESPLARDDATYLITGGLGAIGRHTACWLVERGARHLVLTARHPPDDSAQLTIDELRHQGAKVHVRGVDAGDRSAMSDLLREIAASMPPLRGVIHAAGIVDDGVLQQQDAARWQAVLHGKAHGARHLHDLTVGMPLDFFILYSAAGLLLGPAGQGSYAAANAELDALAAMRRAAGLPATSVAWGMWRDGGMAEAMVRRGTDVWSSRGLGWIAPEQGFERLTHLLRRGVAHAAVMPIDWDRFLRRAHIDPETFAGLGEARSVSTSTDSPRFEGNVLASWRGAPPGQRRGLVLAHLQHKALEVLGLDAGTAVGESRPLKELGLDSLMAVELRNALTRSIGHPLPATLLFDYPTLDALAAYLIRVLDLAGGDRPAQSPGAGIAAAAGAVAALSDEEAEAMLLAELEQGSPRGVK